MIFVEDMSGRRVRSVGAQLRKGVEGHTACCILMQSFGTIEARTSIFSGVSRRAVTRRN